MLVADYDESRCHEALAWVRAKHGTTARFATSRIDAANSESITALCLANKITHVMNAVDPRYVSSVFDAAFAAGCNYMDMGMSLSTAHPTDPFNKPGVKLGDVQFAQHSKWQERGLLALVGVGVEPGLSNVLARYAEKNLFSELDEVSTKDGSSLEVRDSSGKVIFAPSFSIWTTIEECLNPPLIWEEGKGWFTTEPFSELEVFEFPDGIGNVECVNVEHEEVTMLPRTIKAKRFSFKYGLGAFFINALKFLHASGLDRADCINVRSGGSNVKVAPRDVVAAVLPDPASLGPSMTGKTCAGVMCTGKDKSGRARATYLYHSCDNMDTMRDWNCQCVVWQTAFNPVIALELLATGAWAGASGVLGPENFDPDCFLSLMKGPYGIEWKMCERDPKNIFNIVISAKL